MVSEVDELEDVFDAVHRLLGQTDDDDLLLPVLQNSQLGFSGEEIKNLKKVPSLQLNFKQPSKPYLLFKCKK